MRSIELHLYYKEMIDVVSDGLMVVGNDGSILMVNSHMEELTGLFPPGDGGVHLYNLELRCL